MSSLITLIILFGIFYLFYKAFRGSLGSSGKVTDAGSMICQNCGTRGDSKTITRGSIWIEIVLWLCFLVPGLIYSLWRLTTKQHGCPSCGQTNMIPVNTPIGQSLVEKMRTQSTS